MTSSAAVKAHREEKEAVEAERLLRLIKSKEWQIDKSDFSTDSKTFARMNNTIAIFLLSQVKFSSVCLISHYMIYSTI